MTWNTVGFHARLTTAFPNRINNNDDLVSDCDDIFCVVFTTGRRPMTKRKGLACNYFWRAWGISYPKARVLRGNSFPSGGRASGGLYAWLQDQLRKCRLRIAQKIVGFRKLANFSEFHHQDPIAVHDRLNSRKIFLVEQVPDSKVSPSAEKYRFFSAYKIPDFMWK